MFITKAQLKQIESAPTPMGRLRLESHYAQTNAQMFHDMVEELIKAYDNTGGEEPEVLARARNMIAETNHLEDV